MRIRVTTTFIDRQAVDPADAEIAAGTELTVTAERGAELVAAGVAVEIAPAGASRKPRAKRKPKSITPPAPPTAPPSEPASDADSAPTA